jgi:hypothetical protein
MVRVWGIQTDVARNENNEPFVEGVERHPLGANFYPEDMSKEEFETWVAGLSTEDKALAEGYYTVIKRASEGLQILSYADEYKPYLDIASTEFETAANLVSDPSLKTFLLSRAKAFHSNNYVPSDVAWYNVSSSSPLEITAGPYEVYDDALMGYKSGFEIYIHARDFAATETLQKFTSSLKWIEDRLPVEEEYRNRELKVPVIVVVNQLWAGGMGITLGWEGAD